MQQEQKKWGEHHNDNQSSITHCSLMAAFRLLLISFLLLFKENKRWIRIWCLIQSEIFKEGNIIILFSKRNTAAVLVQNEFFDHPAFMCIANCLFDNTNIPCYIGGIKRLIFWQLKIIDETQMNILHKDKNKCFIRVFE